MALPSLGDVHVDAALTDFSRAYFTPQDMFVWNRIAPIIPSNRQSNKYFVYNKAETLRTEAQKRAPGTAAAERNFTLSTDSFFCDVYSLAHNVSEQIIANADSPLDPEQDAVRLLAGDINRRLDVDAAAAFFTTGIWGTDDTDEDWSQAASDPIGALTTGVKTILQNTGFKPNMLVLGADAWYDALANHPDIIDRIPDNQARIATPQFLGSLINVENVLVAASNRNTAAEGLTGSYSFNLGAHALLAYVDPNPGPRTPTAMASFAWSGLLGSADGFRVKRFDVPKDDAYPRVEVDAAVDFKVIGSDLGYFFSSVTS